MSRKTNHVEYFVDPNNWFKSDPHWRGDSNYHTINFLDDTQLSLLEKGAFENLMKLGNLNSSGNLLHCMLLSEVKCNTKNSMAFYVKKSYIEFTLDVSGLVTWLYTKSSSSVLSSIREKGGGSRPLNTYFDVADKLKMGDLKNFMETRKDLCRAYGWGELSFDEIISSLKSSLKPTKTTVGSSYQLIGFPYAFMLKEDGDILSDKQPDNLQGEPSRDPMVDNQNDDSSEKRFLLALLVLLVLNEDQDPGALLMVVCQGHTNRVVLDTVASLSLLFHGHDKLFFDIHASSFEEKKRRAEEGKNTKDHSDEKEEAAEERVTGLGPLNMEEIRQAKNQVELSKSIIIELPDNCI
ncbi:hypothetical protein FXO38_36666 [Capsicum annuum]|nr:hypothetical protein FXO38_36666 [Capsicum annuum]KAF3635883.1 hypothetical protein FXO37_25746 [Capsicum annuum]